MVYEALFQKPLVSAGKSTEDISEDGHALIFDSRYNSSQVAEL